MDKNIKQNYDFYKIIEHLENHSGEKLTFNCNTKDPFQIDFSEDSKINGIYDDFKGEIFQVDIIVNEICDYLKENLDDKFKIEVNINNGIYTAIDMYSFKQASYKIVERIIAFEEFVNGFQVCLKKSRKKNYAELDVKIEYDFSKYVRMRKRDKSSVSSIKALTRRELDTGGIEDFCKKNRGDFLSRYFKDYVIFSIIFKVSTDRKLNLKANNLMQYYDLTDIEKLVERLTDKKTNGNIKYFLDNKK